MFILNINSSENNQNQNGQLTQAEYEAKIAELSAVANQAHEYKSAYERKVALANEQAAKLADYEAKLAAGNAGTVEASPFATDESVRKIIREEQEEKEREKIKSQTAFAVTQHLRQKFRPSVQNVQMDVLLNAISWEADRLAKDPVFKQEYAHKSIAEQVIIAYDIASAGRVVELVDNGNQPKIDIKSVQNQSDYGNANGGAGGGAGSQDLASLEARMAQLKADMAAGKAVDDNELINLDIRINMARRKQAGYSAF